MVQGWQECEILAVDAEDEKAGTLVDFPEPKGRPRHTSRRSFSDVLIVLQKVGWAIRDSARGPAGIRIAHLQRPRKPGREIDDALPDLDIVS